jgi:hypothetical protein
MLDVHPPHEAAHTWKDFFIHIITIVIGLLIAIGLEQTVEFFHHRHQMHAVRERIHDEVLVNQRILHEDERAAQLIVAHMDSAMAAVHRIQVHHPAPAEPLNFEFDAQVAYDAAYTNAKESGTLSLMPYEEAAMYSDAYSASAACTQDAIELWKQLHSAKAAMHGKPLADLGPEEIQPLLTALSEAREKAEGLEEVLKVQELEWNAVLSGHYRNDLF